MNSHDDQIRDLFRDLRAEDQRFAPRFEELRSAARRPQPTTSHRWSPSWALPAIGVAAVGVAVAWVLGPQIGDRPSFVPPDAAESVRPPAGVLVPAPAPSETSSTPPEQTEELTESVDASIERTKSDERPISVERSRISKEAAPVPGHTNEIKVSDSGREKSTPQSEPLLCDSVEALPSVRSKDAPEVTPSKPVDNAGVGEMTSQTSVAPTVVSRASDVDPLPREIKGAPMNAMGVPELPRPRTDKSRPVQLAPAPPQSKPRRVNDDSNRAKTVTQSGQLLVRVFDDNYEPLPGATVQLHRDGQAATVLLSDAYGNAEFPALAPGNGYEVNVSMPGIYAEIRRDEIPIGDGKTSEVQVALIPERVEEIIVRARTDTIEVVSAADSMVADEDFFEDLPVLQREYANALELAPGINDPAGRGRPGFHGSRGDYKMNVMGASSSDPLSLTSAELAEADGGAESYARIEENSFLAVTENPLSTFSIDVDTASYSNVRRFLRQGTMPPQDAVRLEELINYFDYDYPVPRGSDPFSATIEVASCPWNKNNRLAMIGIKGREVEREQIGASNLVFLIDVSGSMSDINKLPMVKDSLRMLVDQMSENDRIAIVVYAGSSGLVLDSTSGASGVEIRRAIRRLEAGGSTNGGSGLRLAYKVARESFIPGGINRVILATDGDFNVGVTSHSELLDLIKKDADAGIFMTALGFGMGNYKDDRLEQLANEGNGHYAYIDTISEAKKVLVDDIDGTLVTIAKDVKIQVEFNPAEVAAYRLIGYENRMLAKEDFNDDDKDAGEIGAGHTVTALYELVPAGQPLSGVSRVDELKYQTRSARTDESDSGELLTLKVRHKKPERSKSKLQEFVAADSGKRFESASEDLRFASAVAAFGMLLRGTEHRLDASFEDVRSWAKEAVGSDPYGYRAEFLSLVRAAEGISER